MLLEDERGSVNLIVPPPVYDRHRPLVRTAPFIRARGRLERREGTLNVLVSDLAPLSPTAPPAAPKNSPRPPRELAVAELRAVAPAGHSFGRRGR
jgi:error-prone DNA polymerase